MTEKQSKLNIECFALNIHEIAGKFHLTAENANIAMKGLARQIYESAKARPEVIPQAVEKIEELWDTADEQWRPYLESVFRELTAQINHPRNLLRVKIAAGLMDEPVAKIKKAKTEAPDVDLTGIFGGKSVGGKGSGIDATDSARKLAAEHGVDLKTVEGNGAQGRITKTDVENEIERLLGDGASGEDD